MTREDLKDYKYNQEWIKGRLEYIEEYRSTLNKITTTLSDMPKGSRAIEDSMAEKLAILLDNIDEIMKVVLKESEKQKRILEQLDKVEQPYKLVLEKVYIQGKSLVTVASELGYSYVHICREHGTALNKFDNVI
ncbi:hypothetical protein [Faecalibacillus faecis]|uniref:hypothetical protein n=1 Tax=Faecalibacillus faecis TaxID=1982628 RepID=UPI003867688C